MSIQTTQRISRERALSILMREIPQLSDNTLGDLLDWLANSDKAQTISRFDNFIVSEFSDD